MAHKGNNKNSWDNESEKLPWNNKKKYHKDYKEIRFLYGDAINYVASLERYKKVFRDKNFRKRQTIIIAGFYKVYCNPNY